MEQHQATQAPGIAAFTAPDWVTVQDFVSSPVGSQFCHSYTAFHWVLRQHRRRLVEAGAVMKIGKRLVVSMTRAPAVFEAIYREQSLAALDRVAA